jgi:transposase-like protein
MSKTGTPVYSREFKLAAVRRMLEGVNVSALSRELQVTRKRLYAWRDSFRAGGPEGLRPRGRPAKAADVLAMPPEAIRSEEPAPLLPPTPVSEPAAEALLAGTVSAAEYAAAQRRIADLERTVGRQQMEMDFFQQALRRVGAARPSTNGSGVTVSTPSSRT